ncbi:MAG: hypothetical protein ACYCPF_22040, partial [Streptosporangiaceae bacterium]
MSIEVLPASGRWDDFASLMVPRKPDGRGCVCMAYRNSSLDMPGRIAHMRGLCEREPGPGVLAYVDEQVAGWCSVALMALAENPQWCSAEFPTWLNSKLLLYPARVTYRAGVSPLVNG